MGNWEHKTYYTGTFHLDSYKVGWNEENGYIDENIQLNDKDMI